MIKGLTLRPAMPDIGAVLRSLLGVVAVTLFALSWGPPASATATAVAAAVAGATALQDSPRGRILLVVGVSVLMGSAVLLGALTEFLGASLAIYGGVSPSRPSPGARPAVRVAELAGRCIA